VAILAKYNEGEWLTKLPDVQRFNEIRKLLLKISVITGWQLPQKEVFDILIDQLDKFFFENFPYFNAPEIEFAFRRYGTQIKDFGREVNLGLFSEVLNTYKSDRRTVLIEAVNKAENAFKPHIYSEDEIINERRGDIEHFYQELRRGNMKVRYYPYFADVLKNDGFDIDPENPQEFFDNCLKNQKPNLYEYEN
jgi:hypothetical protein